MSQEPASY
jgi:hypothetical protein